MASYYDINKRIHDTWVSQSQGSQYFIAIYDEEIHKKLLHSLEISESEYIRLINEFGGRSWQRFKNLNSDIPLVFGIISVQLLAVCRMKGNNLRDIITQVLSISLEQLTLAFNESQHIIWANFKNYIESINLKHNITKASGPHCFVRYPKYQSYLRNDDLKSMLLYLYEERDLSNNLEVRFEDFVNSARLNRVDLFKHYLPCLAIEKFISEKYCNEVLYRQVYRFWLSNDFISDDEKISVPSSKGSLKYQNERGFYLVLRNGNEIKIETQELLSTTLKKMGYLYSKPILFAYDFQWSEYSEVKHIDEDERILIVFLSYSKLANLLKRSYDPEYYKGITIYYVDNNSDLRLYMHDYFTKQRKSLKVVSGVKVTRSAYLKGFGPIYQVVGSPTLHLNDKNISNQIDNSELSLSNLEQGHHVLEITDEPRQEFFIVDTKIVRNKVNEDAGIDLETLETNGSDMVGNILHYNSDPVNLTRDFIDISIGRRNIPSRNNIVLKTLQRQRR